MYSLSLILPGTSVAIAHPAVDVDSLQISGSLYDAMAAIAMAALHLAAGAAATAAGVASAPGQSEMWVHPQGLPAHHNGGTLERLTVPAAGEGKRPHIFAVLFDDYGWAEASWHRNYSIGGLGVPGTAEVATPALHGLVRQGVELDRAYADKCCSPTRSALQSGRAPYHVNPLNAAMEIHNPDDPVSGFAGIPRNMTGVATKLAAAGYATHFFGKVRPIAS
eukprot:SAG22_NODE_3450_length_1705_cov_1.362391_1_plen_221_part_00